MDRQNWKLLNIYRRHLLTRLEYAFGDGHLDDDQYATFHDELTTATAFGQLRHTLVKIRGAVDDGLTRTPRWMVDRDRRRARRQRRWWRPERFWVLGLIMAVVLSLVVLGGLMMVIQWVSGLFA
ncbi:hypothetical protein FB566_0679 [Stackebrandtia endophytica]|uniref:Uncharacterized protein n=1 Tax=Stackebrandtia endophytica TaxID=1496996 RepID=A0A543ARH0_9ACTN|nr:hypothetical protein [Stackebrandtia endophytica]TQL75183.1 hypothetical protein FB566_0679 [Stackebrandtia endophytica]